MQETPALARLPGNLAACLVLLLSAVACGDKMDPIHEGDVSDAELPELVTYEDHIAPLLDSRCTRCHSAEKQGTDRNGAPPEVNLDSYAGVYDNADLANFQIQRGFMPPTGGLPSYERQLFEAWLDDGRLER